MPTPAAELHALMKRFETAMNDRRLDDLDAMLHPDFARYSEATPQLTVQSLDDFKAFLRADAAAFPDNVQTFTHVVVEDDKIGFFATYEGTHQGPLGDIPATGKRVSFDFSGVYTVKDGKLSESWLTWDNVTILSQLGLMPS